MAWKTAAGLMLMAASGLAATVLNVLSKSMHSTGLPFSLSFAAASFAVATGLLICAVIGGGAPPCRLLPWLAVRGLATAAYVVLMFAAVQQGTPIGDVSACVGISSSLAALLGRLLLKESLRWPIAVPAMLVSMLGVVLISQPAILFGGVASASSTLGYLLALLAGACQAMTFVSARKLGEVNFLYQSVSTYMFSAPTSVLLGLLQGEVSALMVSSVSPVALGLWTLAVAVTLAALGPLQSKGALLCPAALSATASLCSRVLFGYAADVVLFGQPLRWLSVLGGALVLGSSALLVSAKKPAVPESRSFKEAAMDVEEKIEQADVEASEVQERFVVEQLRPEDLASVLALEAEIMATQNPVYIRSGITCEQLRRLGEADAPLWLRSGCSLVVRDTAAGGAIVAFAVTEVLCRRFGCAAVPAVEKEVMASSPDSPLFLGLMRLNGVDYAKSPDCDVVSWLAGRTLRFTAGGTRAGYEGLKLQVRLRTQVLQLAAESGFDTVVVRTANNATEHLWRKRFGFEVVVSRRCSEFRLNGVVLAPELDVNMTIQRKSLRTEAPRHGRALDFAARLAMSALRRDSLLLQRR